MTSVEPAIPLVLAGAALLAGSDDGGWLLLGAALLVVALRRWEALALGLPGGAAVAAGLAAEGARWHLIAAGAALVVGTVVVCRRQLPADPLDLRRAALFVAAGVAAVAVGWLPVLDLDRLEAFREGAALAVAGAALAVVATQSTAALRARSGKMEDPAAAGGVETGA